MKRSSIKDNPLVLEISAIILLEKSEGLAISELPDSLLDSWQSLGFDAIWVMGVWTTGELSRSVSVALSENYSEVLPDWTESDVSGSPYAVKQYKVHPRFGGDQALASLREKLSLRGMGLMLDFVPNHVALDHPWVVEYPEMFIEGSQTLLAEQPDNYTLIQNRILAYGRDPYFSGWSDTLQLDYRRRKTREMMSEVLLGIASQCDAVRCDMAMLLLSDVFTKTWGSLEGNDFKINEFWAEAIDQVRNQYPTFKFIAEAYWGLEERLQWLGFDYTYHKSHYDQLVGKHTDQLAKSLSNADFVQRSLFFIENHDEPRAAKSIPEESYRRAVVFHLLTLPGMRLLHDGQMEGYKVHHSVHLGRRQLESVNQTEVGFYENLLKVLRASVVGKGEWQLLATDSDSLLAYIWVQGLQKEIVLINVSDSISDGHLLVQFFQVAGRQWRLTDRLSAQEYIRDGNQMSTNPGLYVKLQPFETQLFQLTQVD